MVSIENLETHISHWAPALLKTERAYRDSLFSYLVSNLPSNASVKKEYRDGGTTTDLFVTLPGWWTDEVYIELKFNLKKKGEFNRLVGQITQLDPKKRKIFIILCGDTSIEYISELRTAFQEFAEDNIFMPYSPKSLFILTKE